MGQYHSMPFGIEYVTGLLGITRRTGAADSASFYADCPFCGKKRKLNVNVVKDTWHCPCCDRGGGMIALYAVSRELDIRTAGRELMKLYSGEDTFEKEKLSLRKKEIAEVPKVKNAAPLNERDAAYNALLSVLSLSDSHRSDLIRRGLTDDAIRYLGYKSTPQHDLGTYAPMLWDKNIRTDRIPGFYGERAEKLVRREKGILIPVKTLWGQISGFQIRYDNLPDNATQRQKENFRKYTWFYSADKENGTSMSGCENIHHAGFYAGACIKKVCLTEGVLKSDIASFISGLPFIGLTGVSNTGQLADALQEIKVLGTEEIYICLDMDYLTNPNVSRALKKIDSICRESGLRTIQVTWPKQYKGIDDFLVYKRKKGLI